MFGRGIEALMEALPRLDGLDQDVVRRLLSGAWLEVAERRELGGVDASRDSAARDLRRLALALQTHAVVVPTVTAATTRACAFVAAEALDIAREVDALQDEETPAPPAERIVVALLYLIAGYDANAAVSVRGMFIPDETTPAERYGLQGAIALVTGGTAPEAPDPSPAVDGYLHDRVRSALWREVGDLLASFIQWLREPGREAADEANRLVQLADELRLAPDEVPIAVHADVQHVARLASAGITEAAGRAARAVPRPTENATSDVFEQFLSARCARQPLLWPAAAEYAATALPGPSASAVVAVPTGAGKTAVADLAIQHAITQGWVLYLAPTNALVGQIRRQLRNDHPGVTVREFFGGAEYTTLAGEALEDIGVGQVLVMTPEKCSLALRQSPEAFGHLALIVFDEAHLLGDPRGRGALSELVLAEALARADSATVLLMSALIANPEALAGWLAQAHDGSAIVIREPWRPTRTLRAVVGVDRPAAIAAAQDAAARLHAMPPHRRNVSFDAPLAVLAGLRGPWTTREPADYAVVKVGATTPMNVTRPRGGGDITIDGDSANVRPTVEALAQLLGDSGQKVVAFLPRSKHDSFLAALALSGFDGVELASEVEALLDLATAELGVETLLGPALAKGVAVHTSALLTEERRASEIAFDEGDAAVLFATGTLAQGLNLPATTVIIGGTDIGYDPDQTVAERRRQQRSQLLNAIGRAGRARVAARSLALVVPNKLPRLDADTGVGLVLPRAEFLAEEDASTQLSSVLRPLLGRLRTEVVEPNDLWPSDHLAIAYLAPGQDDAPTQSILRRTWAAYQLGALDEVEGLAAAIGQLGRQTVDENDGPTWAAEAARRAGVALPVAARFARFALGRLSDGEAPDSVDGWLAILIDAIAHVSADNLGLLLQRDAFRSTALEDLWTDDDSARTAALAATRATLGSWLAGDSLAVVGGHAHAGNPIDTAGRGQRDQLPRTIRLIDTGIGFGLTRAAGLLAATLDVADEQGIIEDVDPSARSSLERLPVALRFGASRSEALALLRAGARPRVVAHTLADRLDAPPPDLDDDGLREWAGQQLARLSDTFEQILFDDDELRLVAQFLLSRAAR
jgi:RAD3-like DEAD/DEAH box helicase/helicase-like protein